jgi:hypothetical protein
MLRPEKVKLDVLWSMDGRESEDKENSCRFAAMLCSTVSCWEVGQETSVNAFWKLWSMHQAA